jgi:hypothetical protein
LVQTELEEILLNSTSRLKTLNREKTVLSGADAVEQLRTNRDQPIRAKRRKSRLLLDATPAKKERQVPVLPVLPPKPVADEFWDWVEKQTHYIPDSSQKYLQEIAAQRLSDGLFDRQSLRKSKRAREKKSQVLSSKLNNALESKPEATQPEVKTEKMRLDEQQVKERLIHAGVYIDDGNELLIELVQAQDELRELSSRNRVTAQLLLKVAKNHDKMVKNREKLFELDKELKGDIVAGTFDGDDFAQKLKQRQKYTRIIDKLQTQNRSLSNASSSSGSANPLV